MNQHKNGPDLLGVVLGMTLLLSAYPAFAHYEPAYEAPISLVHQLEIEERIKDGHEYQEFRFQFVDSTTNEPVFGVKLILHDANEEIIGGARTDFDGFTTLQLSPDQVDAGATLSFETFEYEDVVSDWNKGEKWSQETLNVFQMSKNKIEVFMVGAIVYVPESKAWRHTRQLKRYTRREQRRERRSKD